MTQWVEVECSEDLMLTLNALAIPWTEGAPANGANGTVLVQMDSATDGRLEELVGTLSALRWKYEPGRRLQLALEMPGI